MTDRLKALSSADPNIAERVMECLKQMGENTSSSLTSVDDQIKIISNKIKRAQAKLTSLEELFEDELAEEEQEKDEDVENTLKALADNIKGLSIQKRQLLEKGRH